MKKTMSKKAAPKATEVTLLAEGGDSDGIMTARAAISPSLNAAIAANAYQTNLLGDNIELADLVHALRLQTNKVQDGDLSGLEAMLLGELPSVFRLPVSGSCCLFLLLLNVPLLHVLSRRLVAQR